MDAIGTIWQTDDGSVKLYCGDSISVLRQLPAQSVHCVVTSPPYWALRSYLKQGDPLKMFELGSERTPEEHVAAMVAVFAEVKRVLRDDGLLWVNYGDSYSGGGRTVRSIDGKHREITGLEMPSRPGADGKLDGLQRVGIPERFALAMQADGWLWRDTIVWHKKSPMPASLSGTAWVRCRRKVRGGLIRSGGPDTDGMFAHQAMNNAAANGLTAQWADCPGCQKCEATGGYVLKRGSGRCTPAHEYIYLFAKGQGYFWDQQGAAEACHEKMHTMRATVAGQQLLSMEISDEQAVAALQEMRARSGAGTLWNQTSSGSLVAMVEQRWSRSARGVPAEVSANSGGETSRREICEVVESETQCAAVRNVGEGQADQASRRKTANGESVISGKETSLMAGEKQATIRKGSAEAVSPKSARKNQTRQVKSGVEAYPTRSGEREAQCHQEEATIGGGGLRLDLGRMERDQEDLRSSVRVLREGDGETDPGPCDTDCEGRQSYEEECGPGLSELQREEGDGDFGESHPNPRSVWVMASEPFKGKHFATFPTELARRCIKASTSPEGVCPTCGAQWARVIKRPPFVGNQSREELVGTGCARVKKGKDAIQRLFERGERNVESLGFRPTCSCPPADPIPATVLDPFGGAGTTALAAMSLGRQAILIELNPAYCRIAERRIGRPHARPPMEAVDLTSLPLFEKHQ